MNSEERDEESVKRVKREREWGVKRECERVSIYTKRKKDSQGICGV